MDVRFEEQYLEDLYLTGKTNDKKHRFQPSVVQNYRDRIDELMNVGSARELRAYNALGLEKLAGKKNRRSAPKKMINVFVQTV
jgi:proteic killer suppression protein